MSIHAPQHPTILSQEALRIAIVASQYNALFVDAMLEEAQKELRACAPQALIEVVRVPGSLEIPLLVKLFAERQKPDAIIALGVILRGKTAHADLIAQALTQALLQISLDYSLPVIHEVLLLKSEKQAQARCLPGSLNRGAEAAQAAIVAIQAAHSILSH